MWAGLTSRLVDHEIFLVMVTEMVNFCTLYIEKKPHNTSFGSSMALLFGAMH